MKINDVLECFNKALDAKGNPNGIHYVSYSTWDRNIGSIKSALTIISLIDPPSEPKEVVRGQCTENVPVGLEEKLIEKSQIMALTEFIKNWKYDTGT